METYGYGDLPLWGPTAVGPTVTGTTVVGTTIMGSYRCGTYGYGDLPLWGTYRCGTYRYGDLPLLGQDYGDLPLLGQDYGDLPLWGPTVIGTYRCGDLRLWGPTNARRYGTKCSCLGHRRNWLKRFWGGGALSTMEIRSYNLWFVYFFYSTPVIVLKTYFLFAPLNLSG